MTTDPKAPRYSNLEMEAALCVWECLNEWTLNNPALAKPDWIELREGIGSAELRYQSIALGQWCMKVFDICIAKTRDVFEAMSYDWDVIPLILSHAVDYAGKPVIYAEALPDARATAASVLASVKRSEWMDEAERAAAHLWGYSDLVKDCPEKFEGYLEAGDSALNAAREIGENLDLITPDPITALALPPFKARFDATRYVLE